MSNFDPISDILADLQQGKPIILVDDASRENEGDFVIPAQLTTYEHIQWMLDHARGLICVPMDQEVASRLDLYPMVQHKTDLHKTSFTVSVDAFRGATTGISVSDRLTTIQQLGDPNSVATDFRRPGHIFPLIADPKGVFVRGGHTEGSVDLMKLAGLYPVSVICEILKPDGTMARFDDLKQISKQYGFKMASIDSIKQHRKIHETYYTIEARCKLPTRYGIFDLYIFIDPFTHKEHIALSMGDIAGHDSVLTRIHSSCVTGDIFHSTKCDCGDQLDAAMQMIQETKQGVILYLNQEGRGIGLVNKIKAYQLQEQGLDTVEANEALGFLPDLRDYSPAVQMLRILGVLSVNLITNNPHKVEDLEQAQIKVVERTPSIVPEQKEREEYLQTKKNKMGHFIA